MNNVRYRLKLIYKNGRIANVDDHITDKNLRNIWKRFPYKKELQLAEIITYESLDLTKDGK
jgi:hypothetical protein